MNRNLLIVIIIVVVLVLGGAGYLWATHTIVTLPWAKQTNTTTTNTTSVTGSTDSTPTNLTAPIQPHGDTAVIGSFKVNSVDVSFSSLQRQDTDGSTKADNGKTFLMVYFEPVSTANVLTVDQGLHAATVTDGTTTYPLVTAKVASTYVKGDRGYLKFSIASGAKNLRLQLGSGASAQTIALP